MNLKTFKVKANSYEILINICSFYITIICTLQWWILRIFFDILRLFMPFYDFCRKSVKKIYVNLPKKSTFKILKIHHKGYFLPFLLAIGDILITEKFEFNKFNK